MRPNQILSSAIGLLFLWAPVSNPPAEAGESPTAETLLAESIAHHDPEGLWTVGALRLELEESRPDGSIRETRLLIDNPGERFEYSTTREGALIEGILTSEECVLTLDGSTEISDEDREKHRLTCDRLEWIRNYYVYLWGLPMKLLDPGTRLDPEVRETTFEDREVLALTVTYDESVGHDTWYFYLDPESKALVGYRFYHDESANDGEYIVLEGTTEDAGLRLPRARTWYVNADDELLGTDTLVGLERFEE